MTPIRPKLEPKCITDTKTIKKNIKMSRRYQKVKWSVLAYPPAAVVGGGPSTKSSLEVLRRWPGDIFAINDTAGFLSDNGIPCYLFSVDATEVLYKIGPLVRGAVFASRVHREQFKQFKRADVQVFDMYEDIPGNGDIEGGPTGVCRTPHLLLRMGYRAAYYFGCDGSFYDFTHVTGKSEAALANMMIISVNGVDYLSNAAFLLQNEYLVEVMLKHPDFIINASGGLLKAMLEHPDTWEVTAIRDDLKVQYGEEGARIWTQEYDMTKHNIWRPEVTHASAN